MGERYEQLSFEERCTIARLREAGQSLQKIAAALDRPASTVSRELRRNSGSKVGYQPTYAEQQTRARRWSGSRLERDDALRDTVLENLKAGCSPEQVAGRLHRTLGRRVISYESIYRFIYAQLRRTNDFGWRNYLPRAKSKRGWRGRKGGSPADLMKERRPIGERPGEAENRQTPGHWEADFMRFAASDQAIRVVHERATRATSTRPTATRKAKATANALKPPLTPPPKGLRPTIPSDTATESARHYELRQPLGVQT